MGGNQSPTQRLPSCRQRHTGGPLQWHRASMRSRSGCNEGERRSPSHQRSRPTDVESQATTAETSGSDDGSASVAIGVANVFSEKGKPEAASDFELRNAALTLPVPGITVS